jgi:outer membrane lipoprotein-sorting protein
MKSVFFLLTSTALILGVLPLAAQDVPAILSQADRIFELDKVYSKSTLTITRNGREQAPQVMEGYDSEAGGGTPRSLTIFLAPPRVAGTAYLMMGDDLWVRFASTGRTRKMSSSAKKNSAAGSDFSYADMGEGSQSFSARYRGAYDGEERINGTPCHRLVLSPRPGERDAYEQLTVWISRAEGRYLRIQYSDKGAPVKYMDLEDYRPVGGVEYPFLITMHSLARDSVSVVKTDVMEFNSSRVEERFFNTAYLETIR